jgi:hypothetical protein
MAQFVHACINQLHLTCMFLDHSSSVRRSLYFKIVSLVFSSYDSSFAMFLEQPCMSLARAGSQVWFTDTL